MNQDLKIKAMPKSDPSLCDFIMEKPLLTQGALRITSSDQAQNFKLTKEIFKCGPIKSVLIIGNIITVEQLETLPWQVLGKEVGKAIRTAFDQTEAALDPKAIIKSESEKQLIEKILHLITSRINPAVQSHGGFIELIDVLDHDIIVRMGGGCQGCASSTATLRQGIEQTFREEIPNLGQVIDATDHTAGVNPYY